MIERILIHLLVAFLPLCNSALADQGGPNPWGVDEWTIQTSLYTWHRDPEDYHNNDQNLIGAEAYFNNGWLAGIAVFENSFFQDCQYVFVGRTWQIRQSEHWYFKLTGGLLNGYDEPYEDKIPLNGLGIAPAIIPAIGYRYKMFFTEANLGGLAALTITAGVRF